MTKAGHLGGLLLALLLLPGRAATAQEADAILGTYLNEKQTAHIEIFKDGAADRKSVV